MNVLIGLLLISMAVGFGLMFLDLFLEEENIGFKLGMGLLIWPCLIVLGAVGVMLIAAPDLFTADPLVEGACYQAYGETTIIPVGKVFVPVRGVNLVEIRCP